MKDYVAEFQGRLAEIDADSQTVNIINAGVMNHGKSSLLNSLLGAEIFEVEDIRTTAENKTARWYDDVFLTDTPGLYTEQINDDAAAYEGYRRANFILFVHNVKVGELHKNEIDAINKIKALFNDAGFFWKHFCLILTFKDSDRDGDNISPIKKKTLADIKTNCGGANFPVFTVSNSRYKKGVAENKSKLVELSGIPELRDYLRQNIPIWRNENSTFRAMRISREKNSFIDQLNGERQKIQQKIDSKTKKIQQRQKDFMYKIEAAVEQQRADESKYKSERSRLNAMKSELKSLRDKWQRERY